MYHKVKQEHLGKYKEAITRALQIFKSPQPAIVQLAASDMSGAEASAGEPQASAEPDMEPDAMSNRALPHAVCRVAERIAQVDIAIKGSSRDPKYVKHAAKELGSAKCPQTIQKALVNRDELDYYATKQLKSVLFHTFNTTRYSAVDSSVFKEPDWHQDIGACNTPATVQAQLVKLVKGLKPAALKNGQICGLSPELWAAAVMDELPVVQEPDYPHRCKRGECGICAADVSKGNKGHPLLAIPLCDSCHATYTTHLWWGHQGSGFEPDCRICGFGGSILGCDHCSCAFCEGCLLRFGGDAELSKALSSDDWSCFLCAKSLLLRPGYEENLAQAALFDVVVQPSLPHTAPPRYPVNPHSVPSKLASYLPSGG